MAVAAGNVRTPRDGFFDITLSVALNNVTRGAYGAALINAELYVLFIPCHGPRCVLCHLNDTRRFHQDFDSCC